MLEEYKEHPRYRKTSVKLSLNKMKVSALKKLKLGLKGEGSTQEILTACAILDLLERYSSQEPTIEGTQK
jgi:hypothetical protein